MDNIENFLNIDYQNFIITIFIIIFGLISIIKAIEEISKWIGKPVKWIKKKDDDHILLLQTSKELKELEKEHFNISDELKKFIDKIEEQFNQFTNNRINDRKQSFEIQKELTNSMKEIADNGKRRDEQIISLITGTKELLGDKIDQRFSRYLSLGGIPENEVDEFDGIYAAYEKTGGNSTRKHKYEYIKNNMPVIPVEINLINKNNKKSL